MLGKLWAVMATILTKLHASSRYANTVLANLNARAALQAGSNDLHIEEGVFTSNVDFASRPTDVSNTLMMGSLGTDKKDEASLSSSIAKMYSHIPFLDHRWIKAPIGLNFSFLSNGCMRYKSHVCIIIKCTARHAETRLYFLRIAWVCEPPSHQTIFIQHAFLSRGKLYLTVDLLNDPCRFQLSTWTWTIRRGCTCTSIKAYFM